MLDSHKNISNQLVKTIIVLSCMVAVVMIYQQPFNIRYFQYSSELTCSASPLNDARRWFIWGIFVLPLWIYIKWVVEQNQLNSLLIIKTIAVLVALLVSVILSISILEIFISGSNILSVRVWREFLVYYLLQNGPIYSFGYTFLGAVIYFYYKKHHPTKKLSNLGEKNSNNLDDLKKTNNGENQAISVLKIKVGNTYKIVSVEDIDWIEADDYCVNIHANTSKMVYSMRTSLKSLESLLPESFIRVHRSAIVNMFKVQEYKTRGAGIVKMKSGDEISVAKSKLKVVNSYFNSGQVL